MSFVDGISGAMETFAETEALKSKVARLSDRLRKMEVEKDSLMRALDSARKDVATNAVATEELKTLKREHVDLLTLLGRVETQRVSLGEALERVAGPNARANAERVAAEARKCDFAEGPYAPPRNGGAMAAGDFI